MPINVTATDQNVSVGVSGGQGPAGPQGPQGPAGGGSGGPTTWSGITDKPTTFAPSAHSHPISEVTSLQAALDAKQAAGSYATLDGFGKVPTAQLPSYVDDVLEVANLAAAPATGETGKIYVTIDTGKTYRWSGSAYVEISASPGSTDAVPEGSTNLYHTTGRAAAAAPVQSVAGRTGTVTIAKADVGLGNVDNTADAAKPVSTAQAAADAAVQAAAVQRANHTGTQLAATITDFSAAVQAAAPPTTNASLLTSGTVADARLTANVVLTADARLADSREWTASTVDQAEAEAGTATTRRAFTAQRVFQAIAAWWAGSAAATKLAGIAAGATANATDAQLRDRSTHTGTQAAGTITGLAPVATTGSASDLTAGTVAIGRIPTGSSSSTVCIGNDSRLSDSRTPTDASVTTAKIADGAVTLAKTTGVQKSITSGTAAPSGGADGDIYVQYA
jgi:hypothetical protein